MSEIDYERIDGNHPYWIFFFISFIIIGSFFLLNLFVGVVHSSFKRQTDTLGGYNLMTDNQRELVDIHLMVLKSKPVICLKGGNALYNFCLNIIQAEWFEQMIYCSIILNTIILSVKWGSQSITATFSIKVVNYVFSGIFAVEAILKLAVY